MGRELGNFFVVYEYGLLGNAGARVLRNIEDEGVCWTHFPDN